MPFCRVHKAPTAAFLLIPATEAYQAVVMLPTAQLAARTMSRRVLRALEDKVQAGQSILSSTPAPETIQVKTDYLVRRSQTGNLPVYTEYKASGQSKTIIRKIEGNQQVSDHGPSFDSIHPLYIQRGCWPFRSADQSRVSART